MMCQICDEINQLKFEPLRVLRRMQMMEQIKQQHAKVAPKQAEGEQTEVQQADNAVAKVKYHLLKQKLENSGR